MLGSGITAHYDYPENRYKTVKERNLVFDYTFLIYAILNAALIIIIAVIYLPISILYIIPIPITLLLCFTVLYGVIRKRTGVFYVKYGAMVLVLLGMLALLMMLDRWHVALILVLAFLDVGFLIRNFLDNVPGGTHYGPRRVSELPPE